MLTNPPNLLTGFRILAVPAMVAAFWLPGGFGKWVTCAIFTVAAVTDYFDGYLARSWSMHSPFGRMLDPIADKLLVGAANPDARAFRAGADLPSLVILCREILVSACASSSPKPRSVAGLASRQWKTAVQMLGSAS